MEEPKNPCGCGGSDSSQTRREFLQKAVVVGAGLSIAAIGLTAPTEAHAAMFDESLCLGAAHDAYEACMANATKPSGKGMDARFLRKAKRQACEDAWTAAKALCYARWAQEAAMEMAKEITGQPTQTPITIVVGGIIMIVGGGFVFAL